jgi:DNA-binding transcriptional MerR regulator
MKLHLRWRRNRSMVDRSLQDAASPHTVGQPADGFRGPVVCTLIGITYRQLDYWARTGLLRPSIADARGSGTQRKYSYHDVLELKVIKQLLDAGISLQRARRAVECMRQGMGSDLAAANLVLVGTSSVLAHTDGEVFDLLKGGQGVLNIVPLSGVVEELNADILRIDRESESAAAGATSANSTAAPAEVAGG